MSEGIGSSPPERLRTRSERLSLGCVLPGPCLALQPQRTFWVKGQATAPGPDVNPMERHRASLTLSQEVFPGGILTLRWH